MPDVSAGVHEAYETIVQMTADSSTLVRSSGTQREQNSNDERAATPKDQISAPMSMMR